MKINFSEKQRKVFQTALDDSAGRYILVPGPVRSGKTFSAFAGYLTYTLGFEDTQFGLAAPSQKQIQNILIDAASAMGMPMKASHDYLTIPSGGKPNRIVTFPIERAESNRRIAGHTFQAAFIDEAVDCNEKAVNVLIERCSKPGARIWLLTNPKQPSHWYYERFILGVENGTIPGVHIPFSLDDNPILDQVYKDSLKSLYTGSELKRRYYGQWVVGSGSIYPNIEKTFVEQPFTNNAVRYDISVDQASASITHALLIAYYTDYPGIACIVDEWRHDGRETVLDWNEQLEAITKHFQPWVRSSGISNWIVDVAPAGFQVATSNFLKQPRFGGRGGKVHAAFKTPIKVGIDTVELWQLDNKFLISPKCQQLRRELTNYEWDTNAAERGDDKPIKRDDHGPDALRYYITTIEQKRQAMAGLPTELVLR